MAKFKKGDRVCLTVSQDYLQLVRGDTGTLTEDDDDAPFVQWDRTGTRWAVASDELKLLPVADATGKPAFKVGDRVVALKDSAYSIKKGSISTVIRVDGDHISIRKENGEADGWLAEYFALAPLTIETGKFYRTRDGRKVGPMRWVRPRLGKFCFVDETDAAWAVDGAFDIGGNPSERDLIAEWVDEPASNDNAPATKPAIVALIENGQPKPSEQPKVHKSEQAATDEAERLAVKYPGQKFGVFVLADSRIADVVIRRAA